MWDDKRNIGFRWPEKEDSRYGGPTLKKKLYNLKNIIDSITFSLQQQVLPAQNSIRNILTDYY